MFKTKNEHSNKTISKTQTENLIMFGLMLDLHFFSFLFECESLCASLIGQRLVKCFHCFSKLFHFHICISHSSVRSVIHKKIKKIFINIMFIQMIIFFCRVRKKFETWQDVWNQHDSLALLQWHARTLWCTLHIFPFQSRPLQTNKHIIQSI